VSEKLVLKNQQLGW